MKALGRIFELVREQVAEIGESIAGNAAQRALDEEIREADVRLHEWRARLAEFKARRLTASERHDAAVAKVLEREAQAVAALQAGQASLAREVAAAIVQLEQIRDDESALMQGLDACIAQMAQLVEHGENHQRRLRHQLDVLRTAEAVQRAQETVAGRHPGASNLPQTAIESLMRARRQAGARSAAADTPAFESDATDLDARLRAAGIDDREAQTQAVLARIRDRLAALEPEPPRRTRARTARPTRPNP